MARPPRDQAPPNATDKVARPHLRVLTEPGDQGGLSLADLSEAYAAMLNKGADPYPELDDRSPAPAAPTPEADEPPAIIRGEDEDACEISPRSILEAILFVGHPSNEPLSSERIAGLMRGVRPGEIDELVQELNAGYDRDGCPYRIELTGAGYQMVLRPEFASLRDAFYGRIREARLSQAAVDVLAIIAYRQPIGQAEIDQLRGKPSGGVLSQLVRRDLIRLERSPEKRGRATYSTTDRFLDLFDLDELSDLPRSQELDRS